MEKKFGRSKASVNLVSGVYLRESSGQKNVSEARKLAKDFIELDGRRPRILVAKMASHG